MNCLYCGTALLPDGRCVNQCAEKQHRDAMRYWSVSMDSNNNVSALLAKFPEFNPRWDDEVQKRWFETYDKLLTEFSKPINVMQEITHGDKLI